MEFDASQFVNESDNKYAFKECDQITALLNIRKKQFYRHITHFKRVLRVAQGYGYDGNYISATLQERLQGCKHVDDVRNVLRGSRISYDASAFFLRKYGQPKSFILFTIHEELLLYRIFKFVVYRFLNERPDARSNFLNYAFTLRILAQKIGKNINAQLPAIKSRSTLQKYTNLETWLNQVLLSCPITMDDIVPPFLFTLKKSRHNF